MDRSDDLTRSRRFNSLDLGNGRTRPRIVTTREERVAPRTAAPAGRPPAPSLEFRARQRLRTYAEASTIMDRKTPRDASSAMKHSAPARPEPVRHTPEPAFSDVTPEPPSPMAEAYVGRSPVLTQREAFDHHLSPSSEFTSAEPATLPLEVDLALEAPILSAAAEEGTGQLDRAPALTATEAAQDGLSDVAYQPDYETIKEKVSRDEFDAGEPVAFQTQSPEPGSRFAPILAATGTFLGKASQAAGDITSKSAGVAKSLVAKAAPVWQNLSQGAASKIKMPSLPNIAAGRGEGVKGRVSHLPANSLLTPQVGLLAATARSDAANTRPDANVRPVKSEGIMGNEPEPKRTIHARRIQDNVERTVSRAASPTGPITQTRKGRMALSSLVLILAVLALLAIAAWVTVSVLNRANTPITTIGATERYRIEAILDAMFIDPGTVDGEIDARTEAAITQYISEYGYTGPAEVSTGLLQHLEDEAMAMGVLDLID